MTLQTYYNNTYHMVCFVSVSTPMTLQTYNNTSLPHGFVSVATPMTLQTYYNTYLPHGFVSVSTPMTLQSFPPLQGVGLLQYRYLFVFPKQLAEQSCHSVHVV